MSETQVKLKCYWIYDSQGEHQQTLFAESRGKAIQQSEAYREVGNDFIEISAIRKPQFDKYAEQGFVPKEALLEDGWWFECYGINEQGKRCSKHLTLDNNPIIINNKVYCNHDHVTANE